MQAVPLLTSSNVIQKLDDTKIGGMVLTYGRKQN